MRPLNIVYMGTPLFAVPCLERLVADRHHVAAVITQPDRPKGRGNKLAFSPVKEAALAHQLPVLQPESIKDHEFCEKIAALAPDLIVVVAFGQFLPQRLLKTPPLGCINVHASLLPQYRGAAPIHWAIMNGEKKTGVTTMYMDQGMDTGDMILKTETAIGEQETTGDLHDRLSLLGAELLSETVVSVGEGSAPREPQHHEDATYASLLNRDHEKIDWTQSAHRIHNMVRGLNPWPGAYTLFSDKPVKIWRTAPLETLQSGNHPGQVIAANDDEIIVECGIGAVAVQIVQPAGKRHMSAGEFSRGYNATAGKHFT